MDATMTAIAAVLMVLDIGLCIFIGFRTKGEAANTEDYFIGGKNVGPVLLTFTAWASFSGAGNFTGQAGNGALYGVSAYWFWLGESLLGGIAVGFLMAPYLARFRYLTMPHYISAYLYGDDRYIRKCGGFAALFTNTIWAAAQLMGVAYLLQLVFGINYRIAIVVCGIVFVFYTVTGGVKAVIFADALHGSLQMIFAALVIFFGLKLFHYDIGFLSTEVAKVDPEKMNFFVNKPVAIISSILTGFVGAASNPVFWSRSFAAKDVASAKKAYGFTFICNIVMVLFIITIGISTLIYNTEAGDQALIWAIVNKMPKFVMVFMAVGMLASCMSCADTCLNCGAANLVSDIIDPENKMTAEEGVKAAKASTFVLGVIAIIAALLGNSIYGLGTLGYTVCGGVMIPLFLIGLIGRNRKGEGSHPGIDIGAARFGASIGIIFAIAFEFIPALNGLFGGGIIPALAATALGTVVLNGVKKKQEDDQK